MDEGLAHYVHLIDSDYQGILQISHQHLYDIRWEEQQQSGL